MKKTKFLAVLLGLCMTVTAITGCGDTQASGTNDQTAAADNDAAEPEAEEGTEAEDTETEESEPAETEEPQDAATEEAEPAAVTTDRSGNQITLPAEVNAIISMAPSTTHILIDLGLADKIVAVDTNSQFSYGGTLAADIPAFDMMAPDQETIVSMAPDIVFTSGMSSYDGVDAYGSVRDAGICVADIPSSESLAAIEDDIRFIGDCVGVSAEAEVLANDMQAAIDKIRETASAIPEEEKKTVLFELYTPSPDYPTIYTAGTGTYINEMIEAVGAINIAADEGSQWPALEEEAAVGANPDVILTADMYTPDVINVILTMEGWENVQAIQDGAVYQLDSDEVNQPNHHVVNAMLDMAAAIYPDYFTDVTEEVEALLPAA